MFDNSKYSGAWEAIFKNIHKDWSLIGYSLIFDNFMIRPRENNASTH